MEGIEQSASFEVDTGFEEGAGEEIKEDDVAVEYEEKAYHQRDDERDEEDLEESLQKIREELSVPKPITPQAPRRSLRQPSYTSSASSILSAPSMRPPGRSVSSSNRPMTIIESTEQAFVDLLPLIKRRVMNFLYSKQVHQLKSNRALLDGIIEQHSDNMKRFNEESKSNSFQTILNDSQSFINVLTNSINQLAENPIDSSYAKAKKTIENIVHQLKVIQNQMNKPNERTVIQSVLNEFNQEFQGLVDESIQRLQASEFDDGDADITNSQEL